MGDFDRQKDFHLVLLNSVKFCHFVILNQIYIVENGGVYLLGEGKSKSSRTVLSSGLEYLTAATRVQWSFVT